MNTFGLSQTSFNLLVKAFASFPQIEKVIVFGSRAKGNYKPGSDVDLAIVGKRCTPKLAMELSVKVNEEMPIPYSVDIIDYSSLTHPDLQEHINSVGKLLYQREGE